MAVTTHLLQGWNVLECGAEVKIAGDRPVEALVYYEDAPLDDAVIAAQIVALTGYRVRLGGWDRAADRLGMLARLEVQGQSP